MEAIISSRGLKCKGFQGGIKTLWLLPFEKWMRSQVKIENMELVLLPSSSYYEFQSFGDFGINQNMQENEGGKFYNTNFEIKLDDGFNLGAFLHQEFRVVATDRNGKSRMFGLWNGIQCESIEHKTGSSKSDFNGFVLKFSGQEINEAPYLTMTEDVETNFILLENGSYLLQENLGKFII